MRIYLTYLLSLFLFFSCDQESDEDVNSDIIEQDLTILYHELSNINCIKEVFSSGQQLAFDDSLFLFNTINNSAEISVDSVSSVDSSFINLNFGSSVSLCKDGKFRSGLIKYSFLKPNHYADSANVITVNLVNYRVDTLLLNGNQIIINKGLIDDTLTWEIANNLVITTNKGISISAIGTYNLFLLNTSTNFVNYNQPIVFSSAKFKLKGNSHGANYEGRNYYTNTDNNVTFGFDCLADTMYNTNNLFTKGELYYQSGSLVSTRKCIIFFGNGECDRNYTFKCNGYSLTGKFR